MLVLLPYPKKKQTVDNKKITFNVLVQTVFRKINHSTSSTLHGVEYSPQAGSVQCYLVMKTLPVDIRVCAISVQHSTNITAAPFTVRQYPDTLLFF